MSVKGHLDANVGFKPAKIKTFYPKLNRDALADLIRGARLFSKYRGFSASHCPNCDQRALVIFNQSVWCEACAWETEKPTLEWKSSRLRL